MIAFLLHLLSLLVSWTQVILFISGYKIFCCTDLNLKKTDLVFHILNAKEGEKGWKFHCKKFFIQILYCIYWGFCIQKFWIHSKRKILRESSSTGIIALMSKQMFHALMASKSIHHQGSIAFAKGGLVVIKTNTLLWQKHHRNYALCPWQKEPWHPTTKLDLWYKRPKASNTLCMTEENRRGQSAPPGVLCPHNSR